MAQSKIELANLSDVMLNVGRRNVAPLNEIPNAFNKVILINTMIEI